MLSKVSAVPCKNTLPMWTNNSSGRQTVARLTIISSNETELLSRLGGSEERKKDD